METPGQGRINDKEKAEAMAHASDYHRTQAAEARKEWGYQNIGAGLEDSRAEEDEELTGANLDLRRRLETSSLSTEQIEFMGDLFDALGVYAGDHEMEVKGTRLGFMERLEFIQFNLKQLKLIKNMLDMWNQPGVSKKANQ